MSITREDLLGVANKKEQLSMFEYWSEPEKDPRIVSVQDMVEEYRTTAGQVKGDKLARMMICCIDEEYEEWAYAPTDVEELKEMADLVYVLYGKANATGWNLDEAVRRVHENNMARMYQDDGAIKRREDGKIIKNPNTPKVELGDLV